MSTFQTVSYTIPTDFSINYTDLLHLHKPLILSPSTSALIYFTIKLLICVLKSYKFIYFHIKIILRTQDCITRNLLYKCMNLSLFPSVQTCKSRLYFAYKVSIAGSTKGFSIRGIDSRVKRQMYAKSTKTVKVEFPRS
jgi:hypothetical protein